MFEVDAMNRQSHWNKVYDSRAVTELSWYEPHLDVSLGLIERFARAKNANFANSHLNGAFFAKSQLQGADFEGAELWGAWLVKAELQAAHPPLHPIAIGEQFHPGDLRQPAHPLQGLVPSQISSKKMWHVVYLSLISASPSRRLPGSSGQ